MSTVLTFPTYTPPARNDDVAWTEALVQQADASDGTYALIDTLTLDPVDSDPTTPQERHLTTYEADDTPGKWYRIVWADALAHESLPTVPIQQLGADVTPFTTSDELFRVLRVRQPSTEQTAQANTLILVAAQEIMDEIDLSKLELTAGDVAVCQSVNLDRAADLWRHTESAPGVLGVVDEFASTTPGRYSWGRYAARLSVVKDKWGIA